MAVAIPILISVAVSAASAGISYLAQGKPKPQLQDKNKFSAAEFQASFVQLGTPLAEIYGGRQADGYGGIKTGGNFFYLSDIRHSESVTTSVSSGGRGGGKGGRGNQTTTTKEHHYHQDIGVMLGFGQIEILEIIVNDSKSIYKNYPAPSGGTVYEAEDAVYTNAGIDYNDLWSGGEALGVSAGGTVTFSVAGTGKPQKFDLFYYGDGATIHVAINGVTQTVALPPSEGRVANFTVIGETQAGATTVFIHAPTGGLFLDRIVVGSEVYSDAPQIVRLGAVSGVKTPNFINFKENYNYLNLDNPLEEDWRPVEEYNYQPIANADGEKAVDLPAGASLRIYDGGPAQNPDPVIEAYYSQQGLGAPAYRHRPYFILENFEVTEFGGSTPQFSVICQHKTITTVGELYTHRARRAGLANSEIGFSAFNSIPLRGTNINQLQPPRTEMEIINKVHDLAVIENETGVLTGVVPDETVAATLYLKDLDYADGAQPNAEQNPVSEKIADPLDVPKEMTVTSFDPSKAYENGSGRSRRQTAVSEKVETFNSGLVLTQAEVQTVADRMHQKMWAERNSASFVTAHRHAFLKPYDLVKVETLEGDFRRVRILNKQGGYTGAQKFSGVVRNLLEPFPRIFNYTETSPVEPLVVDVPGHTIGTLIDVAILRTSENTPGIYAACARTDSLYQWKGAQLFWERETGYSPLATLDLEATIGRCVNVLGAPNLDGYGWDSNTVVFDLYHGEVETRTDAEVLDRANILLVGNELIAFANATRVSGFPNRWAVSRLRRQLKRTTAAHDANERIVLLNDAVKFIPLDVSEFDKTHNYKYVSAGQDIESASRFSFTWSGNSKYNTAAYQIGDSNVPSLSDDFGSATAIGDQLYVKLPPGVRDMFSFVNARIRFLDNSFYATAAGAQSADATTIYVSDASSFKAAGGRAYIENYSETIYYAGKSGNSLIGVIRGFETTGAHPIADGEIIRDVVAAEDNLGAKLTTYFPRLYPNTVMQYQLQNTYYLSGRLGRSVWGYGGAVSGTYNGAPTGGTVPPPPPETIVYEPEPPPPPTPAEQNPSNPEYIQQEPYYPGGSYGTICFRGDTLVNLTLEDKLRFDYLYQFRDKYIGTDILAFDKRTNTHTTRKILSIHRAKANQITEVVFSNGLKIQATPTHPVWTENKEMVAISALGVGAKVYDVNFELIEVVETHTIKLPSDYWFYNMTVETDHDYFVGIAVSNNSPALDEPLTY